MSHGSPIIFSSIHPSTRSNIIESLSPQNRLAETILKLSEFTGEKNRYDTLSYEVNRLFQETKEKEKIKIVRPLKRYCLKLLETGGVFTKEHIIFLKTVIESRSYKEAIEILQWPFIQTGQLKSDEILEYLYYGGIIWTVLEQYKNAAEFFGFINRIENKESNMKTDAKKKLTLINLLLGRTVSEKQYAIQYIAIIEKLEKLEGLSKQEESTLKEDGNLPLVLKLKDTLLLKQLTLMASIYNRIPIKNLKPQFALPETISKLNKLQHTYRYDPRSECIIFEGKNADLQKSISRTVKTYLQILSQEKNSKIAERVDREWGGI